MQKDRKQNIYYYLERTLKHSQDVANLIFKVIKNKDLLSFKINDYKLIERALNHDNDKFTENYIEAITDFFHYKDSLMEDRFKEVKYIIDQHKNTKSHHIDYHLINAIPLSNDDIIEMTCDWISSARKDDTNKIENANIWKDNFVNRNKDINLLMQNKDKFFELFDLMEKIIYK